MTWRHAYAVGRERRNGQCSSSPAAKMGLDAMTSIVPGVGRWCPRGAVLEFRPFSQIASRAAGDLLRIVVCCRARVAACALQPVGSKAEAFAPATVANLGPGFGEES